LTTVRFWEETNANIWPAFDYLHFDGWLLRITPGYSRNSNSVWPLYDGHLPLEEKIKFCEQRYSNRGIRCGFRLSDIPGHTAIEKTLIELGYASTNPNLVMILSSIKGQGAAITELPLDDWLETIYFIHPTEDPKMKDWEREFLLKISLPSRYVIVMRQGKACGYGRSVLQGNILNIEKLWVHPDHRNQGFGTQLIQGLLLKGNEDGAEIAYLTVNQSNKEAQRLYTRLGFEVRYSYRYLVPRSDAA
jgi:ribosomal protein S18 acetylase RimI-like enzyme